MSWAVLHKKAKSIEKYVEEFPAPPEPDDSFAEALHTIKGGVQHLIEVTGVRAEREKEYEEALVEE
jgi:hypothetical protein